MHEVNTPLNSLIHQYKIDTPWKNTLVILKFYYYYYYYYHHHHIIIIILRLGSIYHRWILEGHHIVEGPNVMNLLLWEYLHPPPCTIFYVKMDECTCIYDSAPLHSTSTILRTMHAWHFRNPRIHECTLLKHDNLSDILTYYRGHRSFLNYTN